MRNTYVITPIKIPILSIFFVQQNFNFKFLGLINFWKTDSEKLTSDPKPSRDWDQSLQKGDRGDSPNEPGVQKGRAPPTQFFFTFFSLQFFFSNFLQKKISQNHLKRMQKNVIKIGANFFFLLRFHSTSDSICIFQKILRKLNKNC